MPRWACRLLVTVLLGCGCGCGDGGSLLLVEVRTDFLPGLEFGTVRTEIRDPGGALLATHNTPAFRGDDYGEPHRVAEAADMAKGSYQLTVALLDSFGTPVAERPIHVRQRGDQVIVVAITRDCQGVTCPAPDAPELTACLGGRCVDPTCTETTPQRCPEPLCATPSECTAQTDCAAPHCAGGVCLYRSDDTACPGAAYCHPNQGCLSLMDAGTPGDGGIRSDGALVMDASLMDAFMDASMDASIDASIDADSGTCVPLGDACVVPPYHANAVRFEEAGGDYLDTDARLNSSSTSDKGTFSGWFRFTGGDDALQGLVLARILAVGGLLRTPANTFRILLVSCQPQPRLDLYSVGTYTSASGWVHVLASWDLAAQQAHLYINDQDDLGTSNITSGGVCWRASDWGFGGMDGCTVGCDGAAMTADVADIYLAEGVYLDLTVEANRRKFRDAAGKPIRLGAACTAPTGSRPLVCFTGGTSDWPTNKGTGGGFQLNGDGLTTAPTSPSD